MKSKVKSKNNRRGRLKLTDKETLENQKWSLEEFELEASAWELPALE